MNAKCIKMSPGHICECNYGWDGDGFTCSKLNPCDYNQCDENASCLVKGNSYECMCNSDYIGNGYDCTKNLDPCIKADCSRYAIKKIVIDNFAMTSCECICKEGYVGDGQECSASNQANVLQLISQYLAGDQDKGKMCTLQGLPTAFDTKFMNVAARLPDYKKKVKSWKRLTGMLSTLGTIASLKAGWTAPAGNCDLTAGIVQVLYYT